MKRIIRLFFHYARFNLSAAMSYKGAFLTQVLGMVLNNSAFMVFWYFLFKRIGADIHGYHFQDVMFLWSLSTTGFGIAVVFMGNGYLLSRTIYSGELDVYLLQPKPVLMNFLLSRMNLSGWGDMLFGVTLFLLTQNLRPHTIALFVLFSLLLALVFTALQVAYHSLTFFWGNAEAFAQTASELAISFIIYPGSIFKGASVWVLHSLLPAAFMAYMPARLIKSFDLGVMAILIGGDLLIIALALLLFRQGLKHYESGNRMGTRL